jgi:transcriptional regulator with XRE-family HTH domain
MSREHSTPCARELGHEMRVRRERARWNASELGRRLGWPPSKVSRVEAGKYTVSEIDVTHYLAACGVSGPELTEILALKRDEQRALGFWVRTGRKSLAYHESTAATSVGYDVETVPDLLQTPEYAAALAREQGLPDEVHHARLARQTVLRGSVEFAFFVHERALRLPVGGPTVMRDQMARLTVARPSVAVRVVPIVAGPPVVESFRLFEYVGDNKPVVCLERWAATVFLDDPKFVEAYRDAARRLGSLAMSTDRSREFLSALASG